MNKQGRHSEGAEARLRDLITRLGFGDGITEPQADNDTIVRYLQERQWAIEAELHETRAELIEARQIAKTKLHEAEHWKARWHEACAALDRIQALCDRWEAGGSGDQVSITAIRVEASMQESASEGRSLGHG